MLEVAPQIITWLPHGETILSVLVALLAFIGAICTLSVPLSRVLRWNSPLQRLTWYLAFQVGPAVQTLRGALVKAPQHPNAVSLDDTDPGGRRAGSIGAEVNLEAGTDTAEQQLKRIAQRCDCDACTRLEAHQ